MTASHEETAPQAKADMGGNHLTGFSSCNTAEGCGSDVTGRVETRFAIEKG